VVENLALGLAGGAVGILLAHGVTEWLKSLFGDSILRLSETELDLATLGYAFFATFVSSLLFSTAPMGQALQLSPAGASSESSKASESTKAKRWKSSFVIAQFALASILLVGAGLMIRTTAKLYQANPGFPTEQKIVFHWSLDGANYDSVLNRLHIAQHALLALKSIPAIREVGVAYPMPLTGSAWGQYLYVEGHPISQNSRGRSAEYVRINNAYFDAMGIRLVSGRSFNEFDTRKTPSVAIVDTKFIERNFPNSNPIGKRIAHGNKPPNDPNNWILIVGVVEHVEHHGIANDSREQVYRPLSQLPPRDLSFVIDPQENATPSGRDIRDAMRQIDPKLPVRNLDKFDSIFIESFTRERLFMKLLGALAALALILACTGLYGVVSYSVRQQTREFGIRIAVGADRNSIRRMVLSNGAKLAGAGLLIGLLTSLGLSRILSTMLYEVSPFDGTSFAIVTVVLALAGLLACWIPARRATRISPSLALRSE